MAITQKQQETTSICRKTAKAGPAGTATNCRGPARRKICPRGVGLTIRHRKADECPSSEGLFPLVNQAERATGGNGMGAGRAGGAGRNELSHPAESHVFGMENSLQPQSRQTRMSGDGDMGGWLRVRGPFL